MYEPNKILDQFEEVTKPAIFSSFTLWEEGHREILKKLQTILNETKVDLVQNEDWATAPEQLWLEFESKATHLINCLNSFRYIPEDYSMENIVNGWHEKFDGVMNELPKEIRILMGNSTWNSQAGDKYIIRLRKKIQPLKKWLVIKSNAVANIFRKFNGKLCVTRFLNIFVVMNGIYIIIL